MESIQAHDCPHFSRSSRRLIQVNSLVRWVYCPYVFPLSGSCLRGIWRCDMEEGHQICPSMDWHSSKLIAQSIDSSAVNVMGIQSLP